MEPGIADAITALGKQMTDRFDSQFQALQVQQNAHGEKLIASVQGQIHSCISLLEGNMEAQRLQEMQARNSLDSKFQALFDNLRSGMLS